jgi:hypothetical protein
MVGLGILMASVGNQAMAQEVETFDIDVYHGINGRSLGLSKELPVAVTIEKDGAVLDTLYLSFKDRVSTALPAGNYVITVVSDEAGPLPSMTVGPVDIPADVSVSVHAKLSGEKTPVLKVKIK